MPECGVNRLKKRLNWGFLIFTIIMISIAFFVTEPKQERPVKEAKPIVVEKQDIDTKTLISNLKQEWNNDDIIATLEIKDLDINTVITKTTDNKYYLNHDLSKEENNLGNPYIDFRNSSILKDEKQINIYSHNSDYDDYKEKLPFYKLEKYLDKKNFEKSGSIKLLTEEEVLEYEVYAIKIITTDNEHTVLDAKSDELWQHHLDKLLSDTKYCKGDCSLSPNDKLLILQTCNYNPKNSYIVLIAKKIEKKEN